MGQRLDAMDQRLDAMGQRLERIETDVKTIRTILDIDQQIENLKTVRTGRQPHVPA